MTTDIASHPDCLGLSGGGLAKDTTTVTPGSKARQPGALETPRPESGSRARGGAGAILHTATVASPRVSFTQFIALFSGQLAVWSFTAPSTTHPGADFSPSHVSPGNIAALQPQSSYHHSYVPLESGTPDPTARPKPVPNGVVSAGAYAEATHMLWLISLNGLLCNEVHASQRFLQDERQLLDIHMQQRAAGFPGSRPV